MHLTSEQFIDIQNIWEEEWYTFVFCFYHSYFQLVYLCYIVDFSSFDLLSIQNLTFFLSFYSTKTKKALFRSDISDSTRTFNQLYSEFDHLWCSDRVFSPRFNVGRKKLVHLVEQVKLYRTWYVTILGHLDFLSKIFVHFSTVVLGVVDPKQLGIQQYCSNINIRPDAVFDEESEYGITFLFWVDPNDTIVCFWKSSIRVLVVFDDKTQIWNFSIWPISPRNYNQT